MDHQTPSRDTSEETFESITPLELPETPSIEKVDNLPLDPTNVYAKSPGGTLKKLTSPFRRMSAEKIKVLSDDQHTPESIGEGVVSQRSDGKKKKSTARKKAGALVRRFSHFRSKKPSPPEQDEGSVHDDSGSQYGSVEDVEMPLTPEEAEDNPPPPPTTPANLPPPTHSADTEQSLPDIVATEHPVSTLPFAISTWKPKKEPRIVKPVETIGPQDSLRKRITADSPDHSTPTEDERDPPAKSELLSQLVTLAQSQLSSSPLGATEPDPPGRSSRSPSPNPDALARSEQGTTAEVVAGEQPETPPPPEGAGGESKPAAPSDPAMAPHGDLIQGDPAAAAGSAPPIVTGMTAPLQHGPDVRKEHLYKILVIGELGTGKTSIIKRYVHQFFSQHYRATIGVDFALKVMTWDEDTTVRLQLWDIAGQERFGNMTRVYYKEAVGAFIVFDCTRTATFDAIIKWKNDLDSKVQLPDGSNVPCVLLANKCDLHKEGPINNPQKMEDYCKEKGFAGWFETSAKENINIEEATRALVRHILRKDRVIESTGSLDEDRLTIVDDAQRPPAKKCAC